MERLMRSSNLANFALNTNVSRSVRFFIFYAMVLALKFATWCCSFFISFCMLVICVLCSSCFLSRALSIISLIDGPVRAEITLCFCVSSDWKLACDCVTLAVAASKYDMLCISMIFLGGLRAINGRVLLHESISHDR